MEKKFKYCRTEENYDIYNMARNVVTTELRKAKYMCIKRICLSEKIKSDNKLFSSYVRSKTRTKSKVSRLESSYHDLSKCNQETADILNEFFGSLFEIEREEPLRDFKQSPYDG